jgi:hypothetical protein
MITLSKLGLAEAFAALLVVGCATAPRDLPLNVKAGETTAQVRQAMGAPKDRQARGSAEVWQYCRTGVINDSFVAIFFVDGQVAAVRPYQGRMMNAGQCSDHFRPIRWGDPPDIAAHGWLRLGREKPLNRFLGSEPGRGLTT